MHSAAITGSPSPPVAISRHSRSNQHALSSNHRLAISSAVARLLSSSMKRVHGEWAMRKTAPWATPSPRMSVPASSAVDSASEANMSVVSARLPVPLPAELTAAARR